MYDVLITIITFATFYVFLEMYKRMTNVPTHITRKIAHVGSAILSIIFYFFLTKNAFISVTTIFTIVFLISFKIRSLTSVHLTEYKSIGEILYPLSLIILAIFFFHDQFIMITSIAIMGFSDAASGLYNYKYKKNTLLGSMIFFTITVTIIAQMHLIYFNYLSISILCMIILISSLISLTEYHAHHGTDNLFVPLCTAILLSLVF